MAGDAAGLALLNVVLEFRLRVGRLLLNRFGGQLYPGKLGVPCIRVLLLRMLQQTLFQGHVVIEYLKLPYIRRGIEDVYRLEL